MNIDEYAELWFSGELIACVGFGWHDWQHEFERYWSGALDTPYWVRFASELPVAATVSSTRDAISSALGLLSHAYRGAKIGSSDELIGRSKKQ